MSIKIFGTSRLNRRKGPNWALYPTALLALPLVDGRDTRFVSRTAYLEGDAVWRSRCSQDELRALDALNNKGVEYLLIGGLQCTSTEQIVRLGTLTS